MSEREQLLKSLSAYAFAAYDWNLYLDTHPNDADAIAMFRKMTDKANELRQEFVSKFGALSSDEASDSDCWSWISDPWPWDNI